MTSIQHFCSSALRRRALGQLPLGGLVGASWVPLGTSWGPLGAVRGSWGIRGDLLGTSWGAWGFLGCLLVPLGASWESANL